MPVTESEIITEVREVHHEKAYSPILVTEFPIVTEVSMVQP